MKTGHLVIADLGLCAGGPGGLQLHADQEIRHRVAAAAGDAVTKHYLKGQKMKMDSGKTASIFDFETQTVTYNRPPEEDVHV